MTVTGQPRTTPWQPRPVAILPLVFLIAVTLVSGCGGAAPPGAGALEVTVVKTARRDVPVTVDYVGKTQSSRRVEIRSRVAGFLEKRLYQEGSLVEAGQVLFQMDRKPFEAQLQAAEAELAQHRAMLTNAKANLNRVKPLAAQKAVAEKELDDAWGYYRTSAAAVEAGQAKVIQAQLDLGYTTITSPVTGLSSFAKQHEGAYIGGTADSLLTYVAQLDPMWVEFSVSENQLLKAREQERLGVLKQPEAGDFEVEVVLADGTIYPHTGHITFADAAFSEDTGTFLIRAEVGNPDATLRPGQFVRARLKGAVRPDAILVPKRAVQQGAQGSFVWVVDDQGKAEFRPIKTGPWHEDQWFVDQGLQGDETVVVEGALKLRAGAPVKIVEPTKPQSAGRESHEG